jgi:hypothetical protein
MCVRVRVRVRVEHRLKDSLLHELFLLFSMNHYLSILFVLFLPIPSTCNKFCVNYGFDRQSMTIAHHDVDEFISNVDAPENGCSRTDAPEVQTFVVRYYFLILSR